MKKSLTVYITFLFFIGLYSCRPGIAEQAQIQKAHDDSIKNVVSEKYASQSGIKEALNKLNGLQQMLATEKVSLKTEVEKINKMQSDGSGTKNSEQAMSNQQLVIQDVKTKISALDREIGQTQDRIAAIKLETQKYN